MKLPQHKDSLEPKIFHWKPFSMLWGYRTRRLIKSSIKLVYQWRSIEYSVLLATKRTWVQFPAAASSFKQKYDKSKHVSPDTTFESFQIRNTRGQSCKHSMVVTHNYRVVVLSKEIDFSMTLES